MSPADKFAEDAANAIKATKIVKNQTEDSADRCSQVLIELEDLLKFIVA